jgi:hypothetical protein
MFYRCEGLAYAVIRLLFIDYAESGETWSQNENLTERLEKIKSDDEVSRTPQRSEHEYVYELRVFQYSHKCYYKKIWRVKLHRRDVILVLQRYVTHNFTELT